MKFKTQSGSVQVERKADSFVDDTAIGFTVEQKESMTLVAMLCGLEIMAQKWEKLLYSTGGALELKKCFYYLVYWKWDDGIPYMSTGEDFSDTSINLTYGGDNEQKQIERKETDESHRTLGVMVTPNGDFGAQHTKQKRFDHDYGHRLQASNLSPELSRLSHSMQYLAAMTYALPVTTFSKKDLTQQQKYGIRAVLNKLGVSSKFPRAVAYGPTKLGGMNLKNLETEQGVLQVMSYIDGVYKNNNVGKMMRISHDAAQVEAGVGFDILRKPDKELPYLTSCWITSMREYLATYSMAIETSGVNLIPLCCEGDKYIMEAVMDMNLRISPSELHDLTGAGCIWAQAHCRIL